MAAYVILTAFLFQRGSAEFAGSRRGGGRAEHAASLRLRNLPLRLLAGHRPRWPVHCLVRPAPLGKLPGGSGGSGPAWRPAAFADRPPRRHGVLVRILPELAVRVPCHGGAGRPFDRSAVPRLAGVEACGREQQRDRALDVAAESTLRDEPLPPTATHLCVDMQRLFGPGTEWALAWMPRVLPRIVRLCELGPERTIFTRFIPARRPGEGQGTWRRYYRHWASMTLEAVGADMVELMPELARYVPPAETIDKPVVFALVGARPASTASRPGLRYPGRQRRRDGHVRPCHGSRRGRSRLPHGARAGRGLQQLGRKPRFHARALRQPLWPACGGRHQPQRLPSCGASGAE